MLDVANFDLNAIGMEYIRDPYPVLHALRRESPVHRNADGSVFLTRHADVLKVYQSRAMLSDKTEEFGKKFGECPLHTHHTTSLVFNDPPYHTVVRKLLASAFTPRKLAVFEGLIEGIVDRLLDQVEEKGELDLIDDFAKVLPTEIISFMLGIPPEYRQKLRGYSLAILGALDPVVPPERLKAGNEAVTEFTEILTDIIDHRRRNREGAMEGEVLESLIFGEIDGRKLSEEELMQNCIFLLNAGHETTTSLVGNSVGILLNNPDEHRRLLAEPELITTAVEEFLRVESPLQQGNRLAGEDIDLGDVVLPKGTYIHTSIAAANRDPAVFEEPDRVDLGRKPNRHLAFATGIHICLGATLARVEGRIALGGLVRRFPKLAANGESSMVPLARFRGYASLPVRVR
ncbi:cytochrome P450 [Pararhodobacter sp. CCB-MM2]|uniref:cytochrome P450 n=1 Tax=Pararhodobacter sp. CCB-MM2 TaxID=1786003 RepID=UPI0008372E78|nr:cytochrome P450 [Pararhodobacter sp. CCB-MM2]